MTTQYLLPDVLACRHPIARAHYLVLVETPPGGELEPRLVCGACGAREMLTTTLDRALARAAEQTKPHLVLHRRDVEHVLTALEQHSDALVAPEGRHAAALLREALGYPPRRTYADQTP